MKILRHEIDKEHMSEEANWLQQSQITNQTKFSLVYIKYSSTASNPTDPYESNAEVTIKGPNAEQIQLKFLDFVAFRRNFWIIGCMTGSNTFQSLDVANYYTDHDPETTITDHGSSMCSSSGSKIQLGYFFLLFTFFLASSE